MGLARFHGEIKPERRRKDQTELAAPPAIRSTAACQKTFGILKIRLRHFRAIIL
jgi:hypothetical protein